MTVLVLAGIDALAVIVLAALRYGILRGWLTIRDVEQALGTGAGWDIPLLLLLAMIALVPLTVAVLAIAAMRAFQGKTSFLPAPRLVAVLLLLGAAWLALVLSA